MKIVFLDYFIIILYLVVTVGIGLFFGIRQRQAKKVTTDYFLASKSLKWPEIGLALFATNISCIHLVSLAQAGFDHGLLMANFEWMAGFALLTLSVVFVPLYLRSKVTTLPDFLERRYCRACRDWLAVISLITAVIIHVAFSLITGWAVLHEIFGIDKWTCIMALCMLTASYTIFGGLTAVVFTEILQAIVLLVGSFVLTSFAWHQAGGWDGMVTTLQAAGATDKLSLLRPASVDQEFPWYAILLGCPVLGIWAFCADQTIVQRVLAAQDEKHARIGALFCAALKILPVFIFILPGLLFFAIVHQGHIGNLTIHDSKGIYGLMIQTLLPQGFLGLMAAALVAALMGTLSSAANSAATLFSYDIWKRLRPETSDRQLLWVGRLAALFAFLIGIALIPLLDCYKNIFAGANDIIAHLAPPITCVFLVGALWPAASARSAKWTMWLGSALGAFFYTMKIFHNWQPELSQWMPSILYTTPFMMIAFYMFLSCLVLQIALTVFLPKLPHEDPDCLSWNGPLDCLRSLGTWRFADHRLLTALTVVTFIMLYVFFR